jgi:hypothetical protein
MSIVDCSFDHPLKLEERAAAPLAGGIMQHGYQCGMIWGATLAAGARAYRLLGPGPKAETVALIAAQRLVESFRARNNYINCLEITDIKMQTPMQLVRFLLKGGPITCFRMAARYAPEAFSEIQSALSEKHKESHSPPVSCSAMLAQKMGVSDIHRVMVAGFAGGIGLCGGACGALGAAIWISGMNSIKEDVGKIGFQNPEAMDTIDRFITCTNFEFECSKIIGRRFENIGDHADYLHHGGCSKIVELLASGRPAR